MQIEQRTRDGRGWSTCGATEASERAQLTLVFAPTAVLQHPATWAELAALYPRARIVAASSAGEIAGTRVLEDTLVATALALNHGHVAVAAVQLVEAADHLALGGLLAARLPPAGLVHVLVLSDGLKINGSALVAGLRAELRPGVGVTGGLAGDGARFTQTATCVDGPAPSEQVVAIGLYGERLRIGYGSQGGWAPFGPERRITRSEGNVLYELDGEPALDLYERYLGEEAAGLPSSGLAFPLAIRREEDGARPAPGAPVVPAPVVRTIVSVDAAARSLTFAGDVPSGYRARLMHASLVGLIEGARGAAEASRAGLGPAPGELAILISCVGRKLVLRQRTEEELEAVRAVLGDAVLTGFYSYGEIAPIGARCELHNQSMTITTISEH